MPWVESKINSNVTTTKTDSRNLSTTSSSSDSSTTDSSDRSDKSITNIGTGDNSKKSTFSSHDDSQHNVSSTIQKERIEANTTNIGTGDNSSRTQNRSEIRSDRNEVKHDTRISTADSSIHYNMATNSVINIHSTQGVPPLQFVTPPQSAATPMAAKQLQAMPESTNTGSSILGFLGALIPKKQPAEVVSEPFDESLVKPQIIESNMNEDMKDEIKGVLYLAHEKTGYTKDRGIFIREKLNSKFSHEWHCIIGTELDGCMDRNDNYMQLKYKGQTYVIYKTPSPQLHMDLEQKAAVLSKKYEELQKFRDMLSAEKNDLQRAKSSLENEKSNLINENTKLENKDSSLEVQNSNLQKENSEIEVEKTNLNDNITKLNEKLNEYMKKEKNQDEKIEEIQKENQNLLTENKDVEIKNSGLMNEIKKLSAQMESMKKELEIAKPFLEKTKLKNEEIVETYRSKYKLENDKKRIMREACNEGAIEVVRALLDLGFGVNDRVTRYLTGLIVAARNNHANVVSLLLDRGADVNLRGTDSYGWTPLMYAAWNGSLGSAQVLVTRGADKTLRSTDSPKRTALGIARVENEQDMTDYLVSVGVPE